MLFPAVHGVVILVHGSYALTEKWHTPYGGFFQELESKAFAQGHIALPFFWSGSLGTSAKMRAAHVLARLLMSYPPEEKIILAGHSHGGNVIALASQLLFAAQQAYLQTAQYAPPLIRSIAADGHVFKNAIADLTKLLHATAACKKLNNFSRIEAVYFLATPIDMKSYPPCMDVIEHLYNLYSKGDAIQPVFGMYNRCCPDQERITNLRVTFERKRHKPFAPGHKQMHAVCIARWLLDIPNILTSRAKEKIRSGHLHFYKENKPRLTNLRPLAKKPAEEGVVLPTHRDQLGEQENHRVVTGEQS